MALGIWDPHQPQSASETTHLQVIDRRDALGDAEEHAGADLHALRHSGSEGRKQAT